MCQSFLSRLLGVLMLLRPHVPPLFLELDRCGGERIDVFPDPNDRGSKSYVNDFWVTHGLGRDTEGFKVYPNPLPPSPLFEGRTPVCRSVTVGPHFRQWSVGHGRGRGLVNPSEGLKERVGTVEGPRV